MLILTCGQTELLLPLHEDPLLYQHIVDHLYNWFLIFYFGLSMAAKILSVHQTLHIIYIHSWIEMLSLGIWGKYLQLLKVTQGLDQLLSNQFLRFTSNQH
jgi:hypothetical protein